MLRKYVVVVVLSFGGLGCGGSLPATAICHHPSDCAQGLQCLATPSVQYTSVNGQDAGCTETAGNSTCTIPCTTDSDCASLKAPSGLVGSWKCFSGCGPGQSTCGFAG
ncbi:MAG: hypothetical protein ACYCWW_21390 [Deltaproteobacteria bacterium]